MRSGLFGEIISMSWDTVRGNKLRSFLTVLGIVIGITSIVGMTALIRGFDQSFRDLIKGLGPDTIYVTKMSAVSMSSGKSFQELLKRPNIVPADADAIERNASSINVVDITLGSGGPGSQSARIYYGNQRTKQVAVFGTTERWPFAVQLAIETGRFFTAGEVQRRNRVVVLGQTIVQALFSNLDPIDKHVRIGFEEYTVIGTMAKRPSPGGFNIGADDFVVLPFTTYAKQYGIKVDARARGETRPVMIAAVPREGVSRDDAMVEVEQVMRIRHGLRLDEPNDFDLVTQDAFLALWDQISSATFLALVVLSSIALMVGGIGVMSIMTISVTERTREIGVRKALGARRIEILWQFLIEAIFLTSTGGVLGVIFGTLIGVGVHWLSGFPISLPWWSFAIGVGFSATVGLVFGTIPAIRASRLDPIEALRYE
ncbi:MAG: ABC transporter permease [Vicinamibacterales bacterium]